MCVYDALYVHSLLKSGISDYKHELIQVVVPANVTIQKTYMDEEDKYEVK